MKRLFWRVRAAVILHREYGWNRRLSWQYSRGLFRELSELYGDDLPSPREVIDEDRRFWE